MFYRIISATILFILSFSPVWADLTPEALWNIWKNNLENVGGSIEAKKITDSDGVLTLDDVMIRYSSEFEIGEEGVFFGKIYNIDRLILMPVSSGRVRVFGANKVLGSYDLAFANGLIDKNLDVEWDVELNVEWNVQGGEAVYRREGTMLFSAMRFPKILAQFSLDSVDEEGADLKNTADIVLQGVKAKIKSDLENPFLNFLWGISIDKYTNANETQDIVDGELTTTRYSETGYKTNFAVQIDAREFSSFFTFLSSFIKKFSTHDQDHDEMKTTFAKKLMAELKGKAFEVAFEFAQQKNASNYVIPVLGDVARAEMTIGEQKIDFYLNEEAMEFSADIADGTFVSDPAFLNEFVPLDVSANANNANNANIGLFVGQAEYRFYLPFLPLNEPLRFENNFGIEQVRLNKQAWQLIDPNGNLRPYKPFLFRYDMVANFRWRQSIFQILEQALNSDVFAENLVIGDVITLDQYSLNELNIEGFFSKLLLDGYVNFGSNFPQEARFSLHTDGLKKVLIKLSEKSIIEPALSFFILGAIENYAKPDEAGQDVLVFDFEFTKTEGFRVNGKSVF